MCLPAHDPRIGKAKENMGAKPADANAMEVAVTQPTPAPSPVPTAAAQPAPQRQTPSPVPTQQKSKATGGRTRRLSRDKQNYATGLSIRDRNSEPSNGGLNV